MENGHQAGKGRLDGCQANAHFLCRLDHRHPAQHVGFIAALVARVAGTVDQTLLFVEMQGADLHAAALRHLPHCPVRF